MSTVTITLSDTDDGMVAQRVNYSGAFDIKSNAHQYANIMLALAEQSSRAKSDDSGKQRFKMPSFAISGPVSELPK